MEPLQKSSKMGMDIPAIAMLPEVFPRPNRFPCVRPPRTGQVKLADLGFQGSITEKQQEERRNSGGPGGRKKLEISEPMANRLIFRPLGIT